MRKNQRNEPLKVLLASKIYETRNLSPDPRATASKVIGALCLKAYVRAQPDLCDRVDVTVRSFLLDAPVSMVLEEILALRPDVLGLTCHIWNDEEHVRLCRLLRVLAPEIKIVHGGPAVVLLERYLERLGPEVLHVAASGPGEELFAELLRGWLDGAPCLEQIAGIGYFDEEGGVRVTPARKPPQLAAMPPIMTAESLDAMGPTVLYESARGCPYNCTFCTMGHERVQYRSREAIEQDLAAILAHPAVEVVWIVDAALDMRKDHALFLADVVRRHRQHPVHVSGYVFLKARDLGFVRELVGGIDTLQLGLQTADLSTLERLGRKGLTVERFDAMFESVLPWYPGLRVDLMYGFPGLGLDMLRHAVKELLRRDIRYINIFRLVAIPGTELGENADAYGLVAEHRPPYTVHASAGVSAHEMLRMRHFKENMDILRPLFGTGLYSQTLAQGVDLVDFAAALHELSPELPAAVNFEDEHDVAADDDMRDLLYQAARLFTGDAGPQQQLLLKLLRDAYEPGPEARHDDPDAGEDDNRAHAKGDRGVVVDLRIAGCELFIRLEPSAPGRGYYTELGDLGISYGWASERRPEVEARLDGLMRSIVQRLRDNRLGAAELADDPDRAVALIRQSLAAHSGVGVG